MVYYSRGEKGREGKGKEGVQHRHTEDRVNTEGGKICMDCM